MAIAFDSVSEVNVSPDPGTGPITVSHTCSGTNRLLLVGVFMFDSDGVTGVTYNSVAMTQLSKISVTGNTTNFIYIYGLLNPSSGTNTVSCSFTGTASTYMRNVSYNGVSQSGLPDSSASNTAATNVTVTTTTVADNTWLFGMFRSTGGNLTAGTNTTLRNSTNSFGSFDSNGPQTPAGSHSLAITSPGGTAGGVIISFAPSAAVAASSRDGRYLTLLGVGN